MLLWVSGTTVLEATAALSYCCNTTSPGSSEIGSYKFPGGNLLRFKSGFLDFAWSRRPPFPLSTSGNHCPCPWISDRLSSLFVAFSFISHVWMKSYGSQLFLEFACFYGLNDGLVFVCTQTWLQGGLVFVFTHHDHRGALSDVDALWHSLCSMGWHQDPAVSAWPAPDGGGRVALSHQ